MWLLPILVLVDALKTSSSGLLGLNHQGGPGGLNLINLRALKVIIITLVLVDLGLAIE